MSRLLSEWLDYIAAQHRCSVDLGLVRVKKVAEALSLTQLSCPVVIVGGTNGKGSTVLVLETLWREAGFRVGSFTSPWLYRFNEVVKLQGVPVSDVAFISAFEQIDVARGDISLTAFEFNTLAALIIFKSNLLDVVILEVGLGGRLDAVNILSADVAVVTSIALDHMEWLGDTREAIAHEKAGIFREGRPAVCGDLDPPVSLQVPQVPLFLQGQDFGYEEEGEGWAFWSATKRLAQLPHPTLLLQNVATALQVIELLSDRLPVSEVACRQAMLKMCLAGRIEVIPGAITEIRDVSHNPAAVLPLAGYLKKTSSAGRTRAVFSMLSDKDIVGVLREMAPWVDEWFCAPLQTARAATTIQLQSAFETVGISSVHFFKSIQEAYADVYQRADVGDRVIVFGSFYTLSAVFYSK